MRETTHAKQQARICVDAHLQQIIDTDCPKLLNYHMNWKLHGWRVFAYAGRM